MNRRDWMKRGMAALATPVLPARSQQAYPVRPVRLVVPFPPGGPTDIFARQYAAGLGAALGQTVVVDNRSGASGAIAAADVKNAEPDGYVLLFASASTHALYNLISRQPQYDALRDFTHIAVVGGAPAAFGVGATAPQTLQAVVEAARAGPGKLQYGSPGEGTYLHLAAEWLKRAAGGIDIQHIPFRGSAQAMPAMIGGQVAMSVDTLGSLLPNHKAGKLRIIGLAAAKRSPLAPEVPTVDEAIGTKAFEALLWNVIVAPAKLPAPVTAALAAANLKAMANPALLQQLAALSIEPVTDSSPAAATAYIRAEIEKWRPVVEATGIRL